MVRSAGLRRFYTKQLKAAVLGNCSNIHMGKFAQFGLNEFKRGQTHFSQLHISLDPDKLES